MNITTIRSDAVYSKIAQAPLEQKNDIYRNELMMPFEKKWACYRIPIKAATPNGFDVVTASGMYGHIHPSNVDETQLSNIKCISSDELWSACEQSIRRSLACFAENGVDLPVEEYKFTILLADAKSPYITMNDVKRLRKEHPNLVTLSVITNEAKAATSITSKKDLTNAEIFDHFIKAKKGTDPDPKVKELFLSLMSEGLYEAD